jgi:subtilisin family serine protease
VKKTQLLWLCMAVLCLGTCDAPGGGPPQIERHPAPMVWDRGALEALLTHDPDSGEPLQVDLRGYDLSALDLSGSLADLLQASYDSQTIWPPPDRLPPGFDPVQIMELGKNPGLGLRQLHAQGITGQGVGIAVVDAPLLVEHQEYADRLRLYEETEEMGWRYARMHGVAVSSFAVGKTVGVAPEADLYLIATTVDMYGDFRYLARAIRRILAVNEELPRSRRIRAIAVAVGWNQESLSYDEIQAAAAEARAAGLLVVSSSIEEVHGFKFHGLGRQPLADPDALESYEPGWWWAGSVYAEERLSDRLLVPMDSRTAASPTGSTDYTFFRQGGWSWAIPYLAGTYALAAQVDPAITPERFWALALETGRTIEVNHEGQAVPLGPILDPAALIQALQEGK